MIFHRRVVDDVDNGTHDGGTVAGDAVQKRFEPALNEQKAENKNMFFFKKSINGVLLIRTRGRRMVGADETTDLWRPQS